jgi:hypothetical protein
LHLPWAGEQTSPQLYVWARTGVEKIARKAQNHSAMSSLEVIAKSDLRLRSGIRRGNEREVEW